MCCIQTPVARRGFQVNEDTNVKENMNRDRPVVAHHNSAMGDFCFFFLCFFIFKDFLFHFWLCWIFVSGVGSLVEVRGRLLAVYSGFSSAEHRPRACTLQ